MSEDESSYIIGLIFVLSVALSVLYLAAYFIKRSGWDRKIFNPTHIKNWGLLALSTLQLIGIFPFEVNENFVCWKNCHWRTYDPVGDIISSVDYYDILRIITLSISLYFVHLLRRRLNDTRYFGLFAAIVLFNPFFIPSLDKGVWVILNLVFSTYFFYLFSLLKRNG